MRARSALGVALLLAGCGGDGGALSFPTADPNTTVIVAGDDLAATIAGAIPGSRIELGPGEFPVGTLALDGTVDIIGAGMDRTIITGRGPDPVLRFDGEDLSLASLTIRHRGSDPSSVLVITAGAFTLSDLHITGGSGDYEADSQSHGHGVVVSGTASGSIDQSVLTANSGAGVVGRDQARISLNDAEVRENGVAVVLTEDADLIATGATIAANDMGTHSWDDSRLTLEHTTVTDNGGHGIQVSEGASVSLRSSTIGSSRESGIAAFRDATLTLSDTTITGNGLTGLGATDGAVVTGDNVSFVDNEAAGIQLSERASLRLDRGSISGNGHTGLQAGDGSSLTVSGVTISGNASNGIQIKGEVVAAIEGCRIIAHRSSDENRSAGIAIIAGGRVRIAANEISDNDVGIAIAPGLDPEITGNEFTGNGEDVARDMEFTQDATTDTTSPTGTTLAEPSLPAGTPYPDWVTITDGTGAIAVRIPAAWSDRRTGPWSMEAGVGGASLTASPDVGAFISGFDTPGVFFGTIGGTGITPAAHLDTYDLSAACTYGGRIAYEDAAYRGFIDRWVDCGPARGAMDIVAVEPAAADALLVLQIGLVTDADRFAADEILRTFVRVNP